MSEKIIVYLSGRLFYDQLARKESAVNFNHFIF
jgi:hypothetical protein